MTSVRMQKYRLCAERGMSINEVSRLYGVTPHAVRLANRLHNLGFDTRTCRRDRDLAVIRERLRAMAAEGKTRRAMADALEVPTYTVARWCRTWGIEAARDRPWTNGKWMDRLGPHLTAEQADDVDFLRTKKKFSFREALVSVGRADLVEMLG